MARSLVLLGVENRDSERLRPQAGGAHDVDPRHGGASQLFDPEQAVEPVGAQLAAMQARAPQIGGGHLTAGEAHAVQLGLEKVRLRQIAVLKADALQTGTPERCELDPAPAQRDVAQDAVDEGEAGHAAVRRAHPDTAAPRAGAEIGQVTADELDIGELEPLQLGARQAGGAQPPLANRDARCTRSRQVAVAELDPLEHRVRVERPGGDLVQRSRDRGLAGEGEYVRHATIVILRARSDVSAAHASAPQLTMNGALTPPAPISAPPSAEPPAIPPTSAEDIQVKASVSAPSGTTRPTSAYCQEKTGAMVSPVSSAPTSPNWIVCANMSGAAQSTAPASSR